MNFSKITIATKDLLFQLIRIIAQAMNFKTDYYMPFNIVDDKWGKVGENDSYTGLLGEAVIGNADFFLGDLHYTIHNLNYFDLSTPYNTECLTFLTPESLTDNSWKLLILPFRYMDAHVVFVENYLSPKKKERKQIVIFLLLVKKILEGLTTPIN